MTNTAPRKRLINKVDLRFFEDDANGEWGTAHNRTFDSSDSNNSFNAFWDARGLFHDVFEHSHEFTHRYFRGLSAMNIGGEMAAMGSFLYYVETLGLSERLFSRYSFYTTAQMAARTTSGMVAEGVSDGNIQFGDRLECSVPRQRRVDCPYMDDLISEWFSEVEKAQPYEGDGEGVTYEPNDFPNGELFTVNDPREFYREYKNSFTFRKVADLHRWGFHHARRMVPNTCENQAVLTEFIEFWDNFCKTNKAEELAEYFHGIEFRIYRTGEEISWKAILRGKYGTKDATVTANTRHFSVEDYWETDSY